MKNELSIRKNKTSIKIFVFVFTIFVALSLYSCKRCITYYGCCNTCGWHGPRYKSCTADEDVSAEQDARGNSMYHNSESHGGQGDVGECHDYD